MKKFILGIIIGGIIFGSSVYAVTSYLYSSNEVSYTPSDSSWNVGNVKEAIDNLRSTSGTALTDLKNTSIAKAVNANGNSLSSVITTLGSIVNRGKVTQSISPGGSYTIPAGYHNGEGKVTASSCSSSSGYLSETTLWINPSPNSSFSGKTITLDSGSFSNYSFIKFYFKSKASSSDESSIIVPYSHFVNTTNTNGYRISLSTHFDGGARFRNINYVSSNSVKFRAGADINDSDGKYYDSNGSCIPTKITGLNVRP